MGSFLDTANSFFMYACWWVGVRSLRLTSPSQTKMLRIDVEDLFQSYIGSTPHTQDGSHHQHHYIFRFGDPYKPSFATGILRKVSRLSDRDPPLPKYHTPLLVEEGILIDSYSCTRNPGNNEKKHTLITLINHQSLFLMLPS